jgi:hypothetical protein
MKYEGLIVVPVMVTVIWDVMFGLEGNCWLLEELSAAIFMLDRLGSSCTKRLCSIMAKQMVMFVVTAVIT